MVTLFQGSKFKVCAVCMHIRAYVFSLWEALHQFQKVIQLTGLFLFFFLITMELDIYIYIYVCMSPHSYVCSSKLCCVRVGLKGF